MFVAPPTATNKLLDDTVTLFGVRLNTVYEGMDSAKNPFNLGGNNRPI